MRIALRRTGFVALVFAAFYGCNGDSSTTPDPPRPTTVSAAGGTNQTGTAGQPLAQPLSVTVVDQNGAAMAGVSVTWSVTGGGGSVSPNQSATGADGRAQTTWTLGPGAGAQTATATVPGLPSVNFSATAEAGPPAVVTVSPPDAALDALGATTQLGASLTDVNGNPIAGATFTWISENETVATVDDDGEVTAVDNGEAVITATAEGVSGTATVTVAQIPVSVIVAPDSVNLLEGREQQLAAAAFDANGHEINAAAFAWSTSDDGIATVDPTGLVTAVAEGTARITATAEGASAEAVIVVEAEPEDLVPQADTTLTGTVNVNTAVIPAGVTVTVEGELTINALGTVEIRGVVTGDCTPITVDAAGDVTITGSVANDCTVLPSSNLPPVKIVSAGALTLTGAELAAHGGVTVTNDPALAAAVSAPVGFGAPPVSGSAAAVGTCLYENVLVRSTPMPDGADGSPVGGNAPDSPPQVLACAGDMIFRTGNSGVFGNDGGRGGRGQSTGAEVGTGGMGGRGADVILAATGDIVADGVFVLTVSGDGGNGGVGSAQAHPRAEALGGDGGRPGYPLLQVGGMLRSQNNGEFSMSVGEPGDGGGATAIGEDGDDATETVPAEAGGDAIAAGGKSPDRGEPGRTNLIGDLIKGAVAPGTSIELTGEGLLSFGGFASAQGGKGGNGSYELPDPGRGGNMTATGAPGGSVVVVDNRVGGLLDASPGKGGGVGFSGGVGGTGGNGCLKFPFKPGGDGAEGGDATGAPGDGGTRGAVQEDPGSVTFDTDTGDGGDGGPGAGPGAKGTAGSDAFVLVKKDLFDANPNFEDGEDGDPCRFQWGSGVSVQSDPNQHEPHIMMTTVGRLIFIFDAPGMVTIWSLDSYWIPVSGTIDESGNFVTSGTGFAAGFSSVPATFNGTIQVDEDGNMVSFTGTLTVDATNSVLPPDGSGNRNPAVYTVQSSGSPTTF